ncbi:MAG: ATP-binding protein [Candidatus Aminicenantes bacterium]|nr:ATP-binding protein [Candidatus Aminicenantes bacterium]
MIENRYLFNYVFEDLEEKMVLMSGPRQVGKTTLARDIVGKKFSNITYLNWDFGEDRKKILDLRFSPDSQLIILDEIHKYKHWKNFIKGIFDKKKDRFKLLVTGSARLNVFRKGGDSLMGRDYYYRLHPFSLAELMNSKKKIQVMKELEIPPTAKSGIEFFNLLLKFGGFPEPLLKQNERTLRRWHHMRLERITREDINDLETISELSSLQVLADNLPGKVASLLSVNSLTEDLSVSHKTIQRWLEILENFYYHFRVYPFSRSPVKSLKKMPKLFLWDWSQIEDNIGAKLENIVASHLLKFCHFLTDTEGYNTKVYFLRDREGREIDFIITVGEKPWFAVEVKRSGKNVSKHLKYFSDRMDIPFLFQVVMEEDVDFMSDEIRVISASRFLNALV